MGLVAQIDELARSSAARILERGIECEAVIAQVEAYGMRDGGGNELYALVLTVIAEGRTAYQVRIGTAIPAAGLRLLELGGRLPAKRMPHGDDLALAIDWDAALARAARRAA